VNRRRITALLLAIGVAAPAGGCGISTSGPISIGRAPRTRLTTTPVYFVRNGELHATLRDTVPSPAPQEPAESPALRETPAPASPVLSLDLLAAGPSPDERAVGITTELPPGVRMFARKESDDEVSVVLFVSGQRPDQLSLSDLAFTQITCTVVAASALTSTPFHQVSIRDRTGQVTHGPSSCPARLPERPLPSAG
jgi:hypothetical protein